MAKDGMRRRGIAKVAIAVGVAATLTVGGGQAAFADSTLNNTWSNGPRGHASFTSSGEVLRVYDDSSDGYGIEVEFFYSGKIVDCYNNTGKGSVKVCDYSIPDGTPVQYRIWIMQNGAEVGGSASGVRKDTA